MFIQDAIGELEKTYVEKEFVAEIFINQAIYYHQNAKKEHYIVQIEFIDIVDGFKEKIDAKLKNVVKNYLFLAFKNLENVELQKGDVLKSLEENVHFKKKDSVKEEYVVIKQKEMEELFQINAESYGNIVQEYLNQLARI